MKFRKGKVQKLTILRQVLLLPQLLLLLKPRNSTFGLFVPITSKLSHCCEIWSLDLVGYYKHIWSSWLICETRGEFRGGTSPPPPPRGLDLLPTQSVPLLYYFRYPFLVTDRKIFLMAPSAPIYTNFEGEHVPKKRNFKVKIYQKNAQKSSPPPTPSRKF